jgi:predicted nucleic acid-binding protein
VSPKARAPRAILDSDVIYSRVLHELIGRAARGERLLDLIWSDELLDEATRVLRDNKPMPQEVAERWTGYMRVAFPEGRVELSVLPGDVALSAMTNDPDDEHVCALAIAGEADYLFTFDRSYLRDALSAHGVRVVVPDTWLSEVMDTEPSALLRAVQEQASAWGGGRAIGELLDAFDRARTSVFAERVRQALES